MTLEDLDDAVDVWPENQSTVNVFIGMATQWRFGPRGPIGLDYGALPVVMRMYRIPRGDWQDVFEGVRVMESAALDCMSKG